jgi:hypothetical protein
MRRANDGAAMNPWGLNGEGCIRREDGQMLTWDFAADGTGAAIITRVLDDGTIEVLKELSVERRDGQVWVSERAPLSLEKLIDVKT